MKAEASVNLKEIIYDDFSAQELNRSKWIIEKGDGEVIFSRYGIENGVFYIRQTQPEDASLRFTLNRDFFAGESVEFDMKVISSADKPVGSCIIAGINDQKIFIFGLWSNKILGASKEKGLYHIQCSFTTDGAVFTVLRPDGTTWKPKGINISSFPYRFFVETRTGKTGTINVEYDNFKVGILVPSLDPKLADNIKKGLIRSTVVTVINPHPYELKNYPVTLLAENLKLPPDVNLTSISIMDKLKSEVIPCQVDDMDSSKTLTREDEITFLVNLEPFSFKRLILYYDTTKNQYEPAGAGGFVLQDDTSSYLLKAQNYFIRGDNNGKFYYGLGAVSGHFFDLKPWENEKLAYKSYGRVRLVLISTAKVAENGFLTRRIDAYPWLLKMTNSLSSENKKDDCLFKENQIDGFFFGMPRIGDIRGLRYKSRDGYNDDLVATPPKSNPEFFAFPDHSVSSIDLLCPEINLAVIRTASLDYMPGWNIAGGHGYMRGSLAFGWRPPIRILKDKPHIQELYLIPHKGGMEEYQALDKIFREGIVVVDEKLNLQALLAKEKEYIERLTSALRVFPLQEINTEMKKIHSLLTFSAQNDETLLKKYLTCKRMLEKANIGACLLKIREMLTHKESTLQDNRYANYEVAPAIAYLKKVNVYLVASFWDMRLSRYQRSLERLEKAAGMYEKAKEYLEKEIIQRIVLPETKGNTITPYVTFSLSADKMIGFDVDHPGFSMGIDEGWQSFMAIQPKEDVYIWSYPDKIMGRIKEEKKKAVVLLQIDRPNWFKQKYNPPDGYEAMVDPELLGYLPDHMKVWGNFFEKFSERYGNWDEILAWSVINEPGYYHYGGATNQLLEEAIKNYLKKQYGIIDKLNLVWGENFSSFDKIILPKRWQENRAAWYDIILAKMKCLEGALKWQADLLTKHSKCKLTGAKFVPALLSPFSAKYGSAVNPFANNKAQQGISMTDLYLDDEWKAIIRTQELYDSKESPVLSLETGVASRPEQRTYKWHYYPDEKAQSWAWMLFQHGLYGCHYWTWSSNEEFAAYDWDGSMCDFTVQGSLMNQNCRVFGNLLSNLRPIRNIGYYYPYATFIQGSNAEIEPYEKLFWTLTEMGYQVKIFSAFNMDEVVNEFPYLIIPPAPYLERSVVPRLKAYAEKGGILIVTGPATGIYDEYTKLYKENRGSVLSEIAGADIDGYVKGNSGKLLLDDKELTFNNTPAWGLLKVETATPLAFYADNQPAITENKYGMGKVVFIPAVLGAGFGQGAAVVNLEGKWKFRFGASWPQAPGVAATSTAGHIDKGLEETWYSPDYDDSSWETITVPGTWEENGYPGLDGWGWYRYIFTLPKTLAGKRIYFAGSNLDDRAKVYINGQLVKETLVWDEIFSVEVSKYLKYGEKNVIALRIEDTCYLGGIRQYVRLVSPDIITPDEIIIKKILARLGKTPETILDVNYIHRTLMKDSYGNEYLLIANNSDNNIRGEVSIPGRIQKKTEGKMFNLFTGECYPYAEKDGQLKVKFNLGPFGIGLIPLKQVSKVTGKIEKLL